MRKILFIIALVVMGTIRLTGTADAADTILSIGASGGSTNQFSDMVITSDGRPVITYNNSSTGWRVVKCADTSCSSISNDTAIANVAGTGGVQMAIMSNGFPILVFDGTSGLSAYKCSNASCTAGTETLLMSGTNYGQWPDVVVPSDTFPVISFNNNSGGAAMVYKCSNSTCTAGSSTTIYSATPAGANSGISLSSDGLPFVVYGIDNTGLAYTKCGNASCTSGNTNGTIQAYTATSYPVYTSIVRGTDNNPFIAYTFGSSGHAYSYVLRYTKCTNATCTTGSSGQIAGSGDLPYYFKAAMGTDGFPIIAYGGASSMKVTKCGDASCSSGNVTNSIQTGTGSTPGAFNPSIAVDSSNYPFVTWINSASPAGNKLMKCSQTNCAQSSAPSVTTSAAGSVTATTATLNSSVNPNGAATTITYRYGTSNVACASLPSTVSYGSIGSGTSPVSPNAQGISSLTPSTTYYFCATANNALGTVYGSVLNFTTSVGTPTIGSPTKASISYNTVTLGGNITSQGASAITGRGVCYSTTDNTPQLAEGSVTCASTAGTTGIFTVDVSGLNSSTLYYYAAYGTNAYGTSYTSTDNFTTATIPPPTISIQATTNLSSTGVTLNATANPNSFATTAYFRVWQYSPYSCLDGGGVRYPTVGGTALTGSTAQAFSQNITSLIPNKTYYYCAIAVNTGGTNYHSGTPSTFTTPNGPQSSCDVSPTSSITIDSSANCAFPGSNNITGADGVSMTLNAGATLLLQNGQTVVFSTISKPGAYINKISGGIMRKGCIYVRDTDGDGRYDPYSATFSATCPNAALEGQGYVRRKDLVGAPSYLSEVAECNDSSNTVTSASCAPGQTAPSGVTNKTATTATLNAVTNPNGDAGTRAYFKWGSTNTGDCDTLASSTSATLLSGTTSQNYTANISGLVNLTTYYWCTIVYNNSGTSYGDISSFVAQNGAPTITLGSPEYSAVAATTANLNLNITSDGGSAITSRGSCWDTVDGLQSTNCANEGGTTTGTFTHSRTGLTSGAKVYFRGRAINGLGTSYSSVSSFTTAPTLSANSNTVFNRSDLSWNSVTGATAYYVKWCKDTSCVPNSTGSAFGEINVGNVTSYQHSHGNTCGAVMRYVVYAAVSGGFSAESSVQQITTLCPPTITSISADSSSQLTVNYTPASGATGHQVFRCTPSVCTATVQVNTDNATSPYTDTSLATNTGYTYRLKTTSANATSDYSNAMSQTTQASAPPSVTTSAASSITPTTASLNSSVTPNSASTTVYYRYGTSNVACASLPTQVTYGGIGLGTSPVSPNTYALSSLSQGTTYYYCAYATNSQGTTYGAVNSFTTLVYPQDLFTDSNGVLLENHTMNRGSGWTKLIDVGTGNLVITSNTLYTSAALTSSGELYQTNDTMPSADYRVFATMTVGDNSDDTNIIAGRIQDANNMYAVRFNTAVTELYKKVGGTWTLLGSGSTIADGSVVSLNMNGTNIAVLDDGAEKISVTDSSISAAGKAGIGIGGVIVATDDYSAQQLDSFEVGSAIACSNGYKDLDGDGYGAGSFGCYIGAIGNNSDCYDANANANPGQSSYFTVSRGDGSFDYNCDGSSSLRYPTGTWAEYGCSISCIGGGYTNYNGSCSSFTYGCSLKECSNNLNGPAYCGGWFQANTYGDSFCTSQNSTYLFASQMDCR